jgi:hypothetical protein
MRIIEPIAVGGEGEEELISKKLEQLIIEREERGRSDENGN